MASREAFFERLTGALIIPITLVPVAALLVALGSQLQVEPVRAAGLALATFWLPLFFAMSIALSFGGDGMAAITAATCYLVTMAVAESVAGDPRFNVGVLGGVLVGVVITPLYLRVRTVRLPDYLALFDGPRLGPAVAALAGLVLGTVFGLIWAPFEQGVTQLGNWVAEAGGLGVFVYGALLRLLVPTGLHHLLIQLVDTQLGLFVDPATGKAVAGELLRFLAGDPTAGRIHAGHFMLCFTVPAAALAMAHEAPSARRSQIRSLMWTGALSAALLGVTEPIEFAFLFAAPLLFGLHALLQGAAAWVIHALGVRHGGYALPMYLINYHLSERGWLILPVGLAFGAVYYVLFRLAIRIWRPPTFGALEAERAAAPAGSVPSQAAEQSSGGQAAQAPSSLAAEVLGALGGAGNLTAVTACMTRLRVQVRDEAQVDEAALLAAGAAGVVRRGGGAVQVVVGARAGALAEQVLLLMNGAGQQGEAEPSSGANGAAAAPARPAAAPQSGAVTLLSPLTGQVVPLAEVEDEVFAQRLIGDGVAVRAEAGEIRAPIAATVAQIFPGGHAMGLETADGLELLIHVGIGTVALAGEGFTLAVQEGAHVEAGALLGQVDLAVLARRGISAVSPILVTNLPERGKVEVLAVGSIRAGEPLLRITSQP